MKETIVKKVLKDHYVGISFADGYELVSKHGYGIVEFRSDDRAISLVYPIWDGVDTDKRMLKEAIEYFKYVESITGIEVPTDITL